MAKVQETADDAAISKLSAVRQGYVHDPFMGYFVNTKRLPKRSPLINRGYFARVAALELVLRRFTHTCASDDSGAGLCQIVSLGAGMDTTFFRLRDDLQRQKGSAGVEAAAASTPTAPSVSAAAGGGGGGGGSAAAPRAGGRHHLAYFEVDFSDITRRKAEILRENPSLLRRGVAGGGPATEGAAAAGEGASEAAAAPSAAPQARTAGDAKFVELANGGVNVSFTTREGPAPSGSEAGSSATGSAGETAPSSSASAAAAAAPPSTGPAPLFSTVSYSLLTADLRDIAALSAVLREGGLDARAPVLFLSECVLVYLEPEASCAIIAWAALSFPRAVFVTYEQIRPHDAFGVVMARNLAERGYTLRGLQAFPDKAAQRARYEGLGFSAATVGDMNDIYYRMLPRADVARIERLEIFDEMEEWHLMSAHYCIAVAVKDALFEGGGSGGGSGGSAGAAESGVAATPSSPTVPATAINVSEHKHGAEAPASSATASTTTAAPPKPEVAGDNFASAAVAAGAAAFAAAAAHAPPLSSRALGKAPEEPPVGGGAGAPAASAAAAGAAASSSPPATPSSASTASKSAPPASTPPPASPEALERSVRHFLEASGTARSPGGHSAGAALSSPPYAAAHGDVLIETRGGALHIGGSSTLLSGEEGFRSIAAAEAQIASARSSRTAALSSPAASPGEGGGARSGLSREAALAFRRVSAGGPAASLAAAATPSSEEGGYAASTRFAPSDLRRCLFPPFPSSTV